MRIRGLFVATIREWLGARATRGWGVTWSLALALSGCSSNSSSAPSTVICTQDSGETACGSVCVALQTDAMNCGACGHACSAGQSCCAGMCSDPASDLANCGKCGFDCQAGLTCTGGQCICPSSGQTFCGAGCIDVASDTNNCGSCGKTCPPSATCAGGTCQCGGGGTVCGFTCVDTANDSSNCGTCDHSCDSSHTCVNGSCACASGMTACEGSCSDTSQDIFNCGACGNGCSADPTWIASCTAGKCGQSCGEFTQCGSVCVNDEFDDKNCGGCGKICPSPMTCYEAQCVACKAQFQGTCLQDSDCCVDSTAKFGMACTNIGLGPAACSYGCQQDSDCVAPGCCASVVDHGTGQNVKACAEGSVCGGAGGSGGSGGMSGGGGAEGTECVVLANDACGNDGNACTCAPASDLPDLEMGLLLPYVVQSSCSFDCCVRSPTSTNVTCECFDDAGLACMPGMTCDQLVASIGGGAMKVSSCP